MSWQPIETAPKTGVIYMRGPKGGKFRATWMFGLMGVPGWHCRRDGEWVSCGSSHWMTLQEAA